MGTLIKVGVSGDLPTDANSSQTAANRSNRIDKEKTNKATKPSLEKAAQARPGKDDPYYKSNAVRDPAGFRRVTGKKPEIDSDSFISVGLVCCKVTQYNTQYAVQSIDEEGRLSELEWTRFNDAPGDNFDWRSNAHFPGSLDALAFTPFSGYTLDTPVSYGLESRTVSNNVIGPGWWYFYGSQYELEAAEVPSTYTSPLDFNIAAKGFKDLFMNEFDGEVWVLKERPEGSAFDAVITMVGSNLPYSGFSYMLPIDQSSAFLVVVNTTLRFNAMAKIIYNMDVSASVVRKWYYDDTLDATWPYGDYYATQVTYTQNGDLIFMSPDYNHETNNITIKTDVLDRMYDIHVWKIASGVADRITPPPAVIENLRKYMHPAPHNYMRSESYTAISWGHYYWESDGKSVFRGQFGTTMKDIGTSTKTRTSETDPNGGGTYTLTTPDLNGSYKIALSNTMPLYSATNRNRSLSFQWGLGAIASNNHSQLSNVKLDDDVWGAVDSRPVGNEQRWFRYYTPATYALINKQTPATNGYQQFVNGFPSGKVTVTDPTGATRSAFYPPKYLVNGTSGNPISITDPEGYPGNLPSTTSAVVDYTTLLGTDTVIKQEVLDNATHISWDWANPWHCYDQLKALGFTNAELGERPSQTLNRPFNKNTSENQPDESEQEPATGS